MPEDARGLIPVAEARQRIADAFQPLPIESVALSVAAGRVLANPVIARVTQPPADVSAMDGWAARAEDVSPLPATLVEVGEAPAGGAYSGRVGPGEAVRIFTGGPVPQGADTIVIQENVNAEPPGPRRKLTVHDGPNTKGRHIRIGGLDFRAGTVGLPAGRRLTPRDIGLAAAMNVPWVDVRRRPRIALLATGDELVRPGEPVGANQIVSSNNLALAALIAAAGGEAIDLGIAKDDPETLKAMAAGARGADLLVTVGGASVGERDLVQSVLGEVGLSIDFWRIAMRPGKPLMFGRIGATPMLGLPGNPVSALVCGLLFLRPAIDAMLASTANRTTVRARLGRDLGKNDNREDYLRAELRRDADGELIATPFEKQDSSMLSLLARSDCLVIRPPFAPAASAGDLTEIISLEET
jgi:molybdopterin molybdotransferase